MFGSLCFSFISFSASCLSSTLAELNISTSTCRLWLDFLERQEAKLEVADLEMLRFLLGVTRMDNKYSKGTAQARTVWTLRMRRDSGYIGQRMLSMEVPGRRKRGPQRKFMPAVKEDVQRVVGWRWGWRVGWKQMICSRSDMVSVLFLHHQNNVFSQEVS